MPDAAAPVPQPPWLDALVDAAGRLTAADFWHSDPPVEGGRLSAVLVLFGQGPTGPDVLLIERSRDLPHHAGQAAFPGGMAEPDDDGPAATAIREAVEETGLDPGGVEVRLVLPRLWVPPSGFAVVPVLAWWREPCAVRAVDPAEVAAVVRVPVAQLVDPVNRHQVRHRSGRVGPAFDVGPLFVWGFTAGLLSRLLDAAGWSLPWDTSDVRELPERAG